MYNVYLLLTIIPCRRRHAMHRKQKSDEPQPDGGDKE